MNYIKILIIGVVTIALTSCNKQEEIIPQSSATITDNVDGDPQWTGEVVVHTFYDGTGPDDPGFGCAGSATNCLAEVEIVGASSPNTTNLLNNLEEVTSVSEMLSMVSSNYSELSNLINSSILDMVLNGELNLEVESDGDISYLIFRDSENNEISVVKPIKIN